MLRIGVTGHRAFDHVDAVERAVDELLDHLLDGRVAETADGAAVEVWSSLAEGADRIVAARAITRGARLIAVLPLPADDYRTDFETEASIAEFDRLLAVADVVTVTGSSAGGDRTEAYYGAGAEIVRAVDVLVALWDGAPARGHGGTADMVALAHRLGTRVEVVPVVRNGAVR